MSRTCPNGHITETTDYCDQCGTPVESRSVVQSAEDKPLSVDSTVARSESPDLAISPDTAPSSPVEPCPRCRTPRVGSDKFCEVCGYNFAGGDSSGSPAPRQSTPDVTATGSWQAVVEADREYFERVASDLIDFPAHYQPRSFVLTHAEIGIGRHSPARGNQPQIDLSGAPEDPAISHLHAILLRQEDGSYALMDPGSSNGTTLNNDPKPIAANAPVQLADGDRVHLGAWTTLTIRLLEL
jgi:hypothetical protein